MPELPEVETVRRGLQPVLEGGKIIKALTNRKDLRFPFPARLTDRLEGKTIIALSRRAKYLLFSLSDNLTLISHLGMSGSWRVENQTLGVDYYGKGKNPNHDHFILEVKTKTGEMQRIIYNDPRRFGFLLLANSEQISKVPFLKKLGPEPIGNALSGDYLRACFKNKKAPLKTVLLDQSLIAGLGNIYVCESLWRAELSPTIAAALLADNKQKADELAGHIRAVINEAIEAGGSSLRDYVQADGSLGYFQHRFSVYGREGEKCPRCNGQIERLVQGGRSTFYCPSCQKS